MTPFLKRSEISRAFEVGLEQLSKSLETKVQEKKIKMNYPMKSSRRRVYEDINDILIYCYLCFKRIPFFQQRIFPI